MTKDLNVLISKNELAQERFKDLEEYFGGSKSILEDRKEFKKWLERGKQNTKKVDELESKLEQPTFEDCVSRQAIDHLCFEYLRPNTDDNIAFYEHFCDLPPVTPTQCIAAFRFSKEDLRDICNERIEIECTHGTCKDCTNYVAGALDEEICLRGHELIHKDFYCADFKK